MASINYQWLGVSGEVHFPEGTGLNDVGVFAINGDLSLSSFADELSEAKYLNRGNLPLALDYTQPVTPGQVITALGILGWQCTPDSGLQSELDNAENPDIEGEVN